MRFLNETNNLTKTLDDYNEEEVVKRLGGIILVVIFIIVGLLGNGHVLYIYGFKFKPSNYRLFILLLAWLDLFACTISMPFVLTDLLLPLKFKNNIVCKVLRFTNYFVVGSSALVLVAIAIERYLKICNPHKPQMSKRSVKLACGIAIVLSFLLSIPAGILFGRQTIIIKGLNTEAHTCYLDDAISNPKYMSYFNAIIIVIILISNTIIVVLYIRIGQKVYEQKRLWNTKYSPQNVKGKSNNYDDKATKNAADEFSFETSMSLDPSIEQSGFKDSEDDDVTNYTMNTQGEVRMPKSKPPGATRKTLRVTFMLFVISVVYAISFLPHLVLKILTGLVPDFVQRLSSSETIVYYMFLYIIFANNAANPIIYGFCDSRFWEKLRSMYGIKV